MQAFVLRVAPSEIDRVPEALANDQLIIGWANADGLLNEQIGWYKFRRILKDQYYPSDSTYHRAGAAAGHMWRFIRSMEEGDLVVVPYGSSFYVGEVTGPPIFDETKRAEDSAYRRPVKWLNGKQPIPRSYAKSALLSRMKIHGTSASATDLLEDIKECVAVARSGAAPNFDSDLQARLARETLDELRSGRLESYGFETLINNLMVNLGAKDANVIPRSQDKGADVVAKFLLADTFALTVAIQAKHWNPTPPVSEDVVEELISGMEAEGADLGMVVTTGTFAPTAVDAAQYYLDSSGKRVELVDGEQIAKMIVEHGLGDG